MHLLSVGLCAALLTLAAIDYAQAEPITLAIMGAAWVAANPITAAIVSLVFSTAISVGASLLLGSLQKKPTIERGPEPGIQFDIQMGDDNPIAFQAGQTATAGTRKYIGTWGESGGTPNAYLTDVVQVSDLPAPGQPGLWVNGQKCTILWGETPTDQGYPVEEFRSDGKDHLWVKYKDGSQTVADPFLVAKFGSHATRPWESTMIGRGCAFLIITALFWRERFPGNMTWLIEPPPPPWYDLRKDTTAGGSGAHRWNNQATWEATDNPAIIIYNIIRGVYYGDEWVFGGQNLPAFRLPASSWMAAANECDVLRDLDGGGTEKQFRCGMEIRGDMEPLAVIEELKKACAGRLAENGGIFKLLVGAPGAAIYSFTDGEILVTKGQSYTPFPTLDNTFNGIEATYPEPLEMWNSKDAPARYSDVLEAEDGNRRLATGINFAAVPYGVQVQQLMRTMIEEERRFRSHSFFLPPDAFPLEPNDPVAYSSDRNGFVNKKFLISQIVGERTGNQLVVLKEIDPADYSWTSDFELPTDVGPLGLLRPPPQEMTGWQVAPATFDDDGENERRPSIEVTFSASQEDVRAARIQVRLVSSGAVVFDGELPYGAPTEGSRSIVLNGVFLPDTDYEARGIFVPWSGRETEWSEWLAVTTPDVRISQSEFDRVLNARMAQLDSTLQASIARRVQELKEQVSRMAMDAAEMAASLDHQDQVQIIQAGRFVKTAFVEIEREGERRAAIVTTINLRLDNAEGTISAQATVISGHTATLTSHGDSIEANAASITSLDTRLDAAEGSISGQSTAISGLQTTVTAHGDSIAANASAITSLDSRVSTAEGTISGHATAISGLITDVESVDGVVTALSASFTNVFASNAEGNAAAMFRLVAQSAPSGQSARVALEAKTTAGSFGASSAALYLDVASDGSSRATIVASRFVVQHSAGALAPFEVSGDTVTMNANVQINGDAVVVGTLTVDKLVERSVTEPVAKRNVSGGSQAVPNSSLATYTKLDEVGGFVKDDDTLTVIFQCNGLITCTVVDSATVQVIVELRISGVVVGEWRSIGTTSTITVPAIISSFWPASSFSNGTKTIELWAGAKLLAGSSSNCEISWSAAAFGFGGNGFRA